MVLPEVKDDKALLVLCEKAFQTQFQEKYSSVASKTILTLDNLSDVQDSVYDSVILQLPTQEIQAPLLQKILSACKPGAELRLIQPFSDIDSIQFLLKTTGFTNVELKKQNEPFIFSTKPKYQIGSSAKLSLKKPAAAVWKLDDDGDEEVIDTDDLLDQDDLKKPDPSSLRVCGTTGKRKACKDCSCGLAEELAEEAKTGKVVDTAGAPKSSCGSCYLGDAFRCASCPYLGMPAFKPGEKIQLSDNLLKADV